MGPFQRISALADRLRPFAPVALRLGVGLVFLHHGMGKLHMGVGGVAGFFGELGIPVPTLSALVVMTVETAGAACVVLGLWTRLWAALMVVDMAVAILVAVLPSGHSPEIEGLLLAGALALVGLGDGPLALGEFFRKAGPGTGAAG
ncbi:MAG: DoxX family protein [Gemmatimonadales bacterium]